MRYWWRRLVCRLRGHDYDLVAWEVARFGLVTRYWFPDRVPTLRLWLHADRVEGQLRNI